jgi:FAD-dependent oxidoreductase family protein
MPAHLHQRDLSLSVSEDARTLPVSHQADVVILGGGVAGLAAALAAAETGGSVLLIERGNCLGGTATTGMMTLFYTPYRCAHGVPKQIFDRLIASGGAFPGEIISFDHEIFKSVAFEMVAERNVALLLHTICADVIMDGARVRGLVIENKGARSAVLGKVLIDASGDADIAARAGAALMKGRDSDSKMRPMTLLFRIGGIDVAALIDYVTDHPQEFSKDPNQMMLDVAGRNVRIFGFFGLVEEAKRQGYLYPDCHYFRIEAVMADRGTALVNTIRIYDVDGTDPADVTRAEIEGRRQQRLLLRFAQTFVPGFARSYILDSASHIGVRETRRVRGGYVLTEEDIIDKRVFADSIGIDSNRQNARGPRHSPDGKEGSVEDAENRELVATLYTYEIPYRCLVPEKIDGLVVGGRAISANHEADGYTRNQPACMVTGQAAGVAASLAAQSGRMPRDLDPAEIQAALRRLGTKIHANELN